MFHMLLNDDLVEAHMRDVKRSARRQRLVCPMHSRRRWRRPAEWAKQKADQAEDSLWQLLVL